MICEFGKYIAVYWIYMLPCTTVDIQLCNFVPLEVPYRNSRTAVDLQLYNCRSTTRVLYAYKSSLA